jgi:uncharacterized protein Yka (UPF0111/DUF47 family)
MSEEIKPSILRRVLDRIFPKMPDFFTLLSEQCEHVSHSAGLLVEFMESGDPAVGQLIRKDEHDADRVKVHNLHTLNEAFSTPIDREDIYRAIINLDEIVNYCKTTVSEMEALALAPDKHCLEMAMHIKLGTDALAQGYARLAKQPADAAADADAARKAERRVEKTIAAPSPNYSLATTTSTCSSAAKSTVTCPTPPTAWPTAPTRCTTSWSR